VVTWYTRSLRGWLIPNNITRMSSTTLLKALDLIDMLLGPRARLVGRLRIWRNLKVMNIFVKSQKFQTMQLPVLSEVSQPHAQGTLAN
jgi:hypothetical protein